MCLEVDGHGDEGVTTADESVSRENLVPVLRSTSTVVFLTVSLIESWERLRQGPRFRLIVSGLLGCESHSRSGRFCVGRRLGHFTPWRLVHRMLDSSDHPRSDDRIPFYYTRLTVMTDRGSCHFVTPYHHPRHFAVPSIDLERESISSFITN